MRIHCGDDAVDGGGVLSYELGCSLGVGGGGGDGERSSWMKVLLDVDEEEGGHGGLVDVES